MIEPYGFAPSTRPPYLSRYISSKSRFNLVNLDIADTFRPKDELRGLNTKGIDGFPHAPSYVPFKITFTEIKETSNPKWDGTEEVENKYPSNIFSLWKPFTRQESCYTSLLYNKFQIAIITHNHHVGPAHGLTVIRALAHTSHKTKL